MPIVIGTTVIREYDDMFNNEGDVPPEWKAALFPYKIDLLDRISKIDK